MNDSERPHLLLTLEEFFEDGDTKPSIGDERPREFSTEEFFRAFVQLRDREDVADVLVEINDARHARSTDTIWIVTALTRIELPAKLPHEIWDNFLPDDWLSYPRNDREFTKPMMVPRGMQALGFYYS